MYAIRSYYAKIQVLVTFPCIKAYNNGLHNILQEYASKTITYIITKSSDENLAKVKEAYGIDEGLISNEFKNFSLKFGVNINDELLAKSIFIVDKEGVIKYIEIPSNIRITSYNVCYTKLLRIPIVVVHSPGFVGGKNLGSRLGAESVLHQLIGTREPEEIHPFGINLSYNFV